MPQVVLAIVVVMEQRHLLTVWKLGFDVASGLISDVPSYTSVQTTCGQDGLYSRELTVKLRNAHTWPALGVPFALESANTSFTAAVLNTIKTFAATLLPYCRTVRPAIEFRLRHGHRLRYRLGL